jgi:anti-sigma factor RsiW
MLFVTGLSFLLIGVTLTGLSLPHARGVVRPRASDATLAVATPTVLAPGVELAVGYKVTNRNLEPVEPGRVFLPGQKLVAWTAVSGVSAGFVEHVWLHDGEEIARHYLPVGQAGKGDRWRTWSRHTVSVGRYEIRVLGPNGDHLATTTFVVESHDHGC